MTRLVLIAATLATLIAAACTDPDRHETCEPAADRYLLMGCTLTIGDTELSRSSVIAVCVDGLAGECEPQRDALGECLETATSCTCQQAMDALTACKIGE